MLTNIYFDIFLRLNVEHWWLREAQSCAVLIGGHLRML